MTKAEVFSSPQFIVEPRSKGAFVRGLACGLALGLSFWTFVAIEFFAR